MSRSAPCVNSRAPRPRPRRRPGSAPIRAAAALVVSSTAAAGCLIAAAGCGGGTPDIRAARTAAERYVAAVQSHNARAIATLSTCTAPGPSFHGATVLRVEAPRSVPATALDSLAAAAQMEARADSADFASATEENADTLWLQMDAAARRAGLYRDALAAARLAGRHGTRGLVRTCRVHVRIRWGGPLVGPQPVDREHILRLLAASGGRWIVFSLLPRDRDPSGEPI